MSFMCSYSVILKCEPSLLSLLRDFSDGSWQWFTETIASDNVAQVAGLFAKKAILFRLA